MPCLRHSAIALATLLVALPAAAEELSHPADAKAQLATIATMRNLGTAMFAWLTDNLQAGSRALPPVHVENYERLSRQDLEGLLTPRYIGAIPTKDGWGHDLEVYLASDLLADTVMMIRSPGRDGHFDGDVYEPEVFPDFRYDQDLVWSDGFFVCAPQRWEARRPADATGPVTAPPVY